MTPLIEYRRSKCQLACKIDQRRTLWPHNSTQSDLLVHIMKSEERVNVTASGPMSNLLQGVKVGRDISGLRSDSPSAGMAVLDSSSADCSALDGL